MEMDEQAQAVLELMRPFLATLPADMQAKGEQVIAQEPAGVLAWGVKSGYLLWTRTHPGENATPEQRREWFIAGGGDFAA